MRCIRNRTVGVLVFIIKVCKALKDAHIPYAVVGGYAVALHGAVRGTIDVDIVIAWTLENLQRAEKVLKALGLVSRLPINAASVYGSKTEFVEKRNLVAWNFYNPSNPLEQVDLIITYDLQNHKADLIQTALGEISVLSRKDLMAMKKASGRPQDLEDIKALGEL